MKSGEVRGQSDAMILFPWFVLVTVPVLAEVAKAESSHIKEFIAKPKLQKRNVDGKFCNSVTIAVYFIMLWQ